MLRGPRAKAAFSTGSTRALSSRLLSGLSEQAMSQILETATARRLPARSVVTNQGDDAAYCFLITEGKARHFFVTPDGTKLILQWLTSGDTFGLASLLPRRSLYLVGTELLEDTALLVWERRRIKTLAARHPRLLANALSLGMHYLVWFVASHAALAAGSARERLASVLESLDTGFATECAEGRELVISNEELANAANITPFTTSRFLSQWHRSGALIKRRGRIVLRPKPRPLA